MALTTLAAMLLMADGEGVSNIKDDGPQAQHALVASMAAKLGMALFAPDKTARGFSMASIESVMLEGTDPFGLGRRPAVRMRFVNKGTATAFDIYEVKSSGSVNAAKHMAWLLGSGSFEGSPSPHDTVATLKRADTDLAFVGGLVSEPSALELLKRLVKISPN